MKEKRERKNKRKPSERQKRAAIGMIKNEINGGNKTKGKILEECGYCPGVVENPAVVTESLGFLEVFEALMPSDLLAKKHFQLLEDDKSEIQVKALDMAYKINGLYAPEKREVSGTFSLSRLFDGSAEPKKEKNELPSFIRDAETEE